MIAPPDFSPTYDDQFLARTEEMFPGNGDKDSLRQALIEAASIYWRDIQRHVRAERWGKARASAADHLAYFWFSSRRCEHPTNNNHEFELFVRRALRPLLDDPPPSLPDNQTAAIAFGYAQRKHDLGNRVSLLDALNIADDHNAPLPEWAVTGIREALVEWLKAVGDGPGRHSRAAMAAKDNESHRVRYNLVQRILHIQEHGPPIGFDGEPLVDPRMITETNTKRAAFEVASELLRGSEHFADPKAIETSFRRVAGNIERFYAEQDQLGGSDQSLDDLSG